MRTRDARDIAIEILALEGRALDERRWDDWLELYCPDAEYWVPAWKTESQPTEDPDTEISLIYYSDRRGLEERVQRIRSGKSLSSTPLHRTTHLVSHVLIDADTGSSIKANAAYQVNVFDPRSKKQHLFFGRYALDLELRDGRWLIRRKKTLLNNDYIPTMLDIYCI
ncbi:MAG: aromatic-ring-hydroxylating dioxygenase subunit beta [Noviherbaspirillum sp.]